MGEYARVLPGQTLGIRAATWNGILDATEAYRQGARSGAPAAQPPGSSPHVIRVRNDSGYDAPQYGILGIGDIIHAWDENDEALQREFLSNPRVFKGLTPTTAAHAFKWALLLQALPKDQIGAAAIMGIYPCLLSVSDAGHTKAEILNSDIEKLASTASSGSADIVWKETGTGDKHALVFVRPFPSECP
jgi:hypothetical protein